MRARDHGKSVDYTLKDAIADAEHNLGIVKSGKRPSITMSINTETLECLLAGIRELQTYVDGEMTKEMRK